MILQIKNGIFWILLIVILLGCVTDDYEANMIPFPQGLWVNTSKWYSKSAQYDCDGMTIKVWQIHNKKLSRVGPYSEQVILKMFIENAEDSSSLSSYRFSLQDISIKLNNSDSERFPVDYEKYIYKNSALYRFHFKILPEEINAFREFTLTFHLDKAVCDIGPLRFERRKYK